MRSFERNVRLMFSRRVFPSIDGARENYNGVALVRRLAKCVYC